MKSKIEVRKFAIERATLLMGVGSSSKDVVSKAKEIESYILDGIELPDVHDDVSSVFGSAMGLVGAINAESKTKK